MKVKRSNISESVRKELEFDRILELLGRFSKSSLNKERIQNLSIIHNPKVLNYNLDCLQEYQIIESDSQFPSFRYMDLNQTLRYLHIQNAVLTEDQFFQIYDASVWVNKFLHFIHSNEYETPKIIELLGDLKKSSSIRKPIEKVFTPRRFIRSNASNELVRIREDISRKRSIVDKRFHESISHFFQLGFLDDIRESFAEGVSLLAVSSEFKRKVKGRIRSQSKTKSITFIEPENCISLNRELSRLYEEEKQELHRIYEVLTSDLSLHIDRIQSYSSLIEDLDFLHAKLQLALLMEANRPKVSKSLSINIIKAFHPLLLIENNKKGLKTISQDIHFDNSNRVIVISGPNAGGKSIALKTIGLNQLMLQAGLFVPLHPNSSMGIFHQIFTDIGDNQSIENELSTYSHKLMRMKQILKNAGNSSLVLIDEFGSGSDPALGGSLAGVFFQEIVKSGACGVLTTHYGNIKVLADQTEFAENACMLFDEKKLNPLYKLKVGQPGSSYTFEVAKNVGLPIKLIDQARTMLKQGAVRFEDTIHHYQKLTSELQVIRDDVALQKFELDIQKKNYVLKLGKVSDKLQSQRIVMEIESKNLQLGKRVNKLIDQYKNGASIKSILTSLKKIIQKESNRKFENQASKKQSKKSDTIKKKSFYVGQEVQIEGTNQDYTL
jgi:DNA mismatch repair protein MutS2